MDSKRGNWILLYATMTTGRSRPLSETQEHQIAETSALRDEQAAYQTTAKNKLIASQISTHRGLI